MRKKWITRLVIFTMVIMIACVSAWSIFRTSFDAPLTPKDFPLSEKWKAKLRGSIEQITIVGHSVIIARTVSEIYALDMLSGNILWQKSTAWHFSGHPVMAQNGTLFFNDGNGVLALSQSDGKVLWQQNLRHPSGSEVLEVRQDLVAVNDPPYLAMYQALDGTLLWEKPVCREPTQAYFFNNNIIVPCYGLNAIDALSGEIVWETKSEESVDRIWKSAFSDGVIYFSQDFRDITAYDINNQKQLWKTPLPDDYDSYQAYEVVGNYLFVTIDNQFCVMNRLDGRNIWCAGELIKPKNPTILGNDLFLLNGFQNGITAYDIHDGSHIGRLDFPFYFFNTFEDGRQLMVSSDEFLVFAKGSRLFAYQE